MAATVGHSNEPLNTFGFNEVLNVAQTNKPIITQYHNSNVNIDQNLLIDLNHLSIVSKISEGSSSTVYEGRYKTMTVAVKMINPNLESFGSTELIENFAREVMMLSRVKQDNLVSIDHTRNASKEMHQLTTSHIWSAFLLDEESPLPACITFIGASMKPHLLIVTELMKGGSLKRYLWGMRPACPDLQQSISFALDISRAMEHLHANGIIHRDLKPANLVLTEDHKSLKVADFGLAREESTEEMTSEAGTYRWMAPELFSKFPLECEGKQYYDHKIDIYSFAIVLWELLTNKMPFKGMCSIQAVYAVAKKHRPSVDNLPEHLVRLLDSCWAEDPTIRPEFTVITAYLLDILKAKTNEERGTIQLQVTDSPGTCHLMDGNSTQLQVADSTGTHYLTDENSTQLQVADSTGTHYLTKENSPQLPAADSPRTHHVMNENSPQLPAADSPGTRCLMDDKSRTELTEGRKSGNGLFSFVLNLCRRRDVRKKKSGNGLFSCVLGGLGMRRRKSFTRCAC